VTVSVTITAAVSYDYTIKCHDNQYLFFQTEDSAPSLRILMTAKTPNDTAKSIITDRIINDNLGNKLQDELEHSQTNFQPAKKAITNPLVAIPVDNIRSANCPK
jgi:hypothetical protein